MFFVSIVITSLNVKHFPVAAEIQVVIRKWLLLGVRRPLQVYKMSVSSRYRVIEKDGRDLKPL